MWKFIIKMNTTHFSRGWIWIKTTQYLAWATIKHILELSAFSFPPMHYFYAQFSQNINIQITILFKWKKKIFDWRIAKNFTDRISSNEKKTKTFLIITGI